MLGGESAGMKDMLMDDIRLWLRGVNVLGQHGRE
jgi:hypothetical protein